MERQNRDQKQKISPTSLQVKIPNGPKAKQGLISHIQQTELEKHKETLEMYWTEITVKHEDLTEGEHGLKCTKKVEIIGHMRMGQMTGGRWNE